MTAIIPSISGSLAIPSPRVSITIRPGVMSDVPFLDSLQKIHSKQVGWMPTKQFEGKIKAGHVLIAEMLNSECRSLKEDKDASISPFQTSQFRLQNSPYPVGYCIGNDQYFKRDDVGIIYQMNVVPGKQRGYVGAALLRAQFERSAYGCKLYCCWCAQDIAANHFWEAMGFVPLAFRAGSAAKGRVHIFWQKRIRRGDTTTPWWFPCQTSGGSIREDRLVLPIPPGTHWSEAKPIVLPGMAVDEPKRLPGERKRAEVKPKAAPPVVPAGIAAGGLRFAPPATAKAEATKPKCQPKPKAKNDPRLIAAARELRDRWLEQVNADPSLLLPAGKYEVSRCLAGPLPNPPPSTGEGEKALLPAA